MKIGDKVVVVESMDEEVVGKVGVIDEIITPSSDPDVYRVFVDGSYAYLNHDEISREIESFLQEVKVGDDAVVEDIPNEFSFASDSQEVEAILQSIGVGRYDYDSAFVYDKDGEYIAVFGMYGIVPVLDRTVKRLK